MLAAQAVVFAAGGAGTGTGSLQTVLHFGRQIAHHIYKLTLVTSCMLN